MVDLTPTLFTAEGKSVTGVELTALEWSRDASAPCDALWLWITAESDLPEIDRVMLERDGDAVFSGYCDLQRETDSAGHSVCLYARSDAALLVDSEAAPGTFNGVTANTLFTVYAAPMGFQSALPRCSCSGEYMVNKGATLYGAVNDFVYALTGKSVCVSPQRVLYLPDGKHVSVIPADAVLETERSIHRGDVISRIDFKTEGDAGYDHHLLSRTLDAIGIRRSRKLNLSALPYWQQNAALQGQMQRAADGCYRASLTVSGCPSLELYGSVQCPLPRVRALSEYRIAAFTVRLNKNGVKTQIQLTKPMKLKEITYVAE